MRANSGFASMHCDVRPVSIDRVLFKPTWCQKKRGAKKKKKNRFFDHIDVAAGASACASVCVINRLMGTAPGRHISVPAQLGGGGP